MKLYITVFNSNDFNLEDFWARKTFDTLIEHCKLCLACGVLYLTASLTFDKDQCKLEFKSTHQKTSFIFKMHIDMHILPHKLNN